MKTFSKMSPVRSDWKLLAFDIDGTLTRNVAWTAKDALLARPNLKMIQNVNSAYDAGHIIILYTARRDALMSATFKWCKDNGIRFHGINNCKMPADKYIDDKAEGANG